MVFRKKLWDWPESDGMELWSYVTNYSWISYGISVSTSYGMDEEYIYSWLLLLFVRSPTPSSVKSKSKLHVKATFTLSLASGNNTTLKTWVPKYQARPSKLG